MYRQGISESQFPAVERFVCPQFIILNTAVGGAWRAIPMRRRFPTVHVRGLGEGLSNPPTPTNLVASSAMRK